MPPHLATHLTLPNLRLLAALDGGTWWRDYLSRSIGDRADLLRAVLECVDFPPHVVDALVATPRHRYALEQDEPIAYLNTTLPLQLGSALSAPGLVAYYLTVFEELRGRVGTIHEIGLGSGFHAAALSRLLPDAAIVGFEANASAAECAVDNLATAGNVEVRAVAVTHDDIAAWTDLIGLYSTTASAIDLQPLASAALVSGGVSTVVRPLSETEFAASSTDTWLQARFEDYSAYKSRGWSEFCCVNTVFKGSTRDSVSLYGVTFVPWSQQGIADPRRQRMPEVEEFRDDFD